MGLFLVEDFQRLLVERAIGKGTFSQHSALRGFPLWSVIPEDIYRRQIGDTNIPISGGDVLKKMPPMMRSTASSTGASATRDNARWTTS